MPEGQHFATRAVHAGERAAQPDFRPTNTPIYAASSFYYESTEDLDAVFGGERAGFVYSRYGNPTVAAFERTVASLEGAEAAVAFASGMGAIHATLLAAGVERGKTVVAARDVYGATVVLLTDYLVRQGVNVVLTDMADPIAWQNAIDGARPHAVLFETISNPLLKLADVDAICRAAHDVGAQVIVDSTFATPCLFRPLEHGADWVLHSATKYLAGHGDVTSGVVASRADRCDQLRLVSRIVGPTPSPFDSYLALRGVKTLPLRMRQHCANALAVAEWLAGNPKIRKVNYPGLRSHPQHALARRLFPEGMYGGVVSFDLAEGTRERVFDLLARLRLCLPATTLGDIYTLLLCPAMTSHRALTPEQRQAVGIGEGLIRISVGIEDAEDIIADLDQALAG